MLQSPYDDDPDNLCYARGIFIWALIAVGVITALVISSAAHAEDWLRVASSKTAVFEARKGTLQHGLLGTSPAVTMVLRTKVGNGNIAFERVYVTVEDCGKGYGTLVTNSIQGKFLSQDDYVIGGGSIACTIAEVMCSIVNKPATTGMSF